MHSPTTPIRAARCLGAAILLASTHSAFAEDDAVVLPVIEISATGSASLVSPGTAEARRTIERTPGGVALVPAESFDTTPEKTVKDVLDYVPGVFVQPKWGDDTRLSIRGSGLSRNFHLRGVQLFMDGIPINTADGYGDFQEIDPSAYRYVEVFKGANALRYGANALGGAINFVTPTGHDATPAQARIDFGGFGFHRTQASSGGASGNADYFVTGAWSGEDGFREHSNGHSMRGSANIGFRLTPDVETRFYLNASHVRQNIPGSVSREDALHDPEAAAPGNLALDQERNIDTLRLANKTTIDLDDTRIDLGIFAMRRHLQHPIYQWLDYRYRDLGGFARATHEGTLGGFTNRLVAGVNIHGGTIENKQYVNDGGNKGDLVSSSRDDSLNLSGYAENTVYVLPEVGLVGGLQYLYATRDRDDRYLSDGDQSGRTEFSLFSPKAGIVWEVDPRWQVFANISRSAEVPSFGESATAVGIDFTDVKAQRATTIEIGTRGEREDFRWDLSLYRAQIKNELLCLYSSFGNCTVTNADRTVHQGVELGFGVGLLKDIFAGGGNPDRLWLNAAYTLNDFRFDNDEDFGDNVLPGAPRHFLRAELLYKHPAGFSIGPNVEWVPQAYYVDSANTLKTKAYALFGARAAYDNGRGLTAYVEARNLADTKYIASASIIDVATPTSTLFEPGSGRAVYAGLSLSW